MILRSICSGNAENDVDREGSCAAEDKIVGSFLQGFRVGRGMRGLDKQQQLRPIIASEVAVRGRHVVDGAVETLENRIPLRAVGGSAGFLVPKDRLQLFHELV